MQDDKNHHVFPKGTFPQMSQRISRAIDELRNATEEAKVGMALFVGEKGEPYNARIISTTETSTEEADSHFNIMALTLFERYNEVFKLALQKSNMNPIEFFSQSFFGTLAVTTLFDRLNLFTYNEQGGRGILSSQLVAMLHGKVAEELVSQYFYDVWFSVDVEDARRLVMQMTNNTSLATPEAEQAFRHIFTLVLTGLIGIAEKIANSGDAPTHTTTAKSTGFPVNPTQSNDQDDNLDIANLLNGLDLF